MGELIGVGISESETFGLGCPDIVKLKKPFFDSLSLDCESDFYKFVNGCRLNALYMICSAGSGHIGSSFSSAEFICMVEKVCLEGGHTFFSSKGHDSPIIYAIKMALGEIPEEYIEKFRSIDGLPGHPEANKFGAAFSTGSLGMGISKAKGLARANFLNGHQTVRIFVLLGDGEMQEGQIWESLTSLSTDGFNITIVVDHNKIQSDMLVKATSDLGNIEKKLKSFGLMVKTIDGHSMPQIKKSIEESLSVKGPNVIILDTIKGRGISLCEKNAQLMTANSYYKYHSGALSAEDYLRARDDILEAVGLNLGSNHLVAKELIPKKEDVEKVRLMSEYGAGLYELCGQSNIAIYDADLMVDNSLVRIKENYPKSFMQVGIAEQDMVSQAGATSLRGITSYVHSFAAFLTGRANEQIYNNQLQGGNVIYVGSLAGVTPSQPGSSHQGVRDIASLGGIPNLIMFEPITSIDARNAAQITYEMKSSCYMRVVSTPQEKLAVDDKLTILKLGEGYKYRVGKTKNNLVIAFGTTFSRVCIQILDQSNEDINLILMPWINVFSKKWLKDELKDVSKILLIADHIVGSGPDSYFTNEILNYKIDTQIIGVNHPLFCGRNEEVMERMMLDRNSIKNKMYEFFNL